MPYIKQDERKLLDDDCKELSKKIEHEGQLNYVITKLCHGYLKKHGKNYSKLNTLHGVLNCVDKELYRKVTALYEEEKIKENGDIN